MADPIESERVWRRRRKLLYAVLFIYVASIALFFGPNVILFGKLTWLSPKDFKPLVDERCRPIVNAILQYHLQYGQYPDRRQWHPSGYQPGQFWGWVDDGIYTWWGEYNHMITYDLNAKNPTWNVRGPYTKGIIPSEPLAIRGTSPTTNVK